MKSGDFIVGLSFVALITLPGLLSNLGLAGNHTNGTLLAVLVIYFLHSLSPRILFRTNFGFVFFVLAMGLHACITLLLNFQAELGLSLIVRIFGSLSVLVFVYFGIQAVLSGLMTWDDEEIARLFDAIYYGLIILGFFSLPFHYFDWVSRKQMLFFSEPSHFAIISAPFLLYKFRVLSARGGHSTNLHAALWACLAVTLSNLTLLAALALAMLAYIRLSLMRMLTIVVLVSIFVAVLQVYFLREWSHIESRLLLSAATQNLSVLVYLSGFERMSLALEDTYFLGSGLQTLGSLVAKGSYQDIIFGITGSHMNLEDGATLIVKSVSEFGIFGLTFAASLCVASVIGTWKIHFTRETASQLAIFLSSVIIMSPVLLFVRFVGYFSPATILLFIALIYFTERKSNER